MNLKSYLWLLPFISFLGGYYLIRSLYHVTTIKAPDIIGSSLLDAIRTTSAANLTLKIIGEKEDPELAEGTILRQTPAAHSTVKSSQTIFVLISKKPAKKLMPNLTLLPITEAERICAALPATLKIVPIESNHPKDVCIGQWPSPGCELPTQPIIAYSSNGGKKMLVLPDFRHKPLSNVAELLQVKNMRYEITPQELADSYALHELTVIDQRPLPGTFILTDANMCVYLRVAALSALHYDTA